MALMPKQSKLCLYVIVVGNCKFRGCSSVQACLAPPMRSTFVLLPPSLSSSHLTPPQPLALSSLGFLWLSSACAISTLYYCIHLLFFRTLWCGFLRLPLHPAPRRQPSATARLARVGQTHHTTIASLPPDKAIRYASHSASKMTENTPI